MNVRYITDDGDDSNDGLTEGTGWATLGKALTYVNALYLEDAYIVVLATDLSEEYDALDITNSDSNIVFHFNNPIEFKKINNPPMGDYSASVPDPPGGSVTYADVSDVRFGVDRGDGSTGTCYVPLASEVLNGVNVDATTGTVTLPEVGEVEDGVFYGAGGTEFEGTLEGEPSGINVDPEDVRYDVDMGNGETGSCYVPLPEHVKLNVQVDDTVGTFVPSTELAYNLPGYGSVAEIKTRLSFIVKQNNNTAEFAVEDDLTAIDITCIIESSSKTDVAIIANADLNKTSNSISFDLPAEVYNNLGSYVVGFRDSSTFRYYGGGSIVITYAPHED
jgi:hypothetical protein